MVRDKSMPPGSISYLGVYRQHYAKKRTSGLESEEHDFEIN